MPDERTPPRSQLEPLLGDVLRSAVRRLVGRGRSEIGKAAESGRQRLALRQHQKDLDHFWIRLGKTAFRLVEAGEIDHPALRKAIERIDELETRIDEIRGPQPDKDDSTTP
ncbi:MAG: hypothetical protein KC621_27790 [Myxococcales bacterium]|nr:hypothetical protein [Myxococcales bacterium]